MSPIEIDLEYQRRLNAMTPKEKVARAAAMLAWTRGQIAARIRNEQPGLSDEQIKWRVALQLYESEPEVVALIQRHLANVHSARRTVADAMRKQRVAPSISFVGEE